MSARKTVRLPGPFTMRHGGVLPEVDVVYETWGALTPERDNALLLLTGLSPSAHAASSAEDPSPGWWEEVVGPGKAIDTDRFFVVCVNSLGSPHGTTGPASTDPRTGKRYRLTFPVLTIEDIATAAHEALRAIGLTRLRALVGPSLGGMSALAYAILFPGDVDNLVTISSAARATPFAIAIRSVQREAIRTDPEWKGGEYVPPAGPVTGLRLARKLGLITYRSAAEWRQRFKRERTADRDEGVVRDRVRGRGLPGDARAQVRGHLRRELLSLSLPLDGPVRRGGARRIGGGGAGPHPRAADAGDRRDHGLPVPARPAGGDRDRAARAGP